MKKVLFFRNMPCLGLLFLVVCFLFPNEIKAQEAQGTIPAYDPYIFSSSSQTFTYISGGVNTNISTDDALSSAIPIGFSFKFSCLDYTKVYASSNGFLSFLSSGGSILDNSSASAGKFLAPFWDDLNGSSGTAGYITTGTAPNRVFTMEWKNWRRHNGTDKTLSFQVKLYEGSNVIEYLYQQEAANTLANISASIGLFDGPEDVEQRWLNNASSSPSVSGTKTTNISMIPASGQVYSFTPTNCSILCIGRTTLNNSGGNNQTDGLKIIMSGAGNLQVRRNGGGQIYSPDKNLTSSTSNVYETTDSKAHGIGLAIGQTQYTAGTLASSTGFSDGGKLRVISNTCQADAGPDGQGFEHNTIRLAATKNTLNYYLTVTYSYHKPDNYFFVEYTIEIPANNTEVVKLAHGWDTYLSGSDKGPGFIYGNEPYVTMGTFSPSTAGVYEAFQYISGTSWSGYYSALFSGMGSNLGDDYTFNKTIDTSTNTDNGIGISINFGSLPGNQTSKARILFKCNSPNTAPVLTQNSVNCTNGSVNLTNYVVPLNPNPNNIILVWKSVATNLEVADPTNVNVAGKYIVVYKDTVNNCESIESVFEIKGVCSCTKLPSKAPPTLFTKLGITSYSKLQENWPAKIPNGFIALESKHEGLVLTRTTPANISNPIEGMLIYDSINNCFSLYNGTSWKCIKRSCNE